MMTKIATCCFLALATANAIMEWMHPPMRASWVDDRQGR